MLHHVVDIRPSLDGTPVVEVTVDLAAAQLSAAAHAVRSMVDERYRLVPLESADDILAMRELTALQDELDALALPGAVNRLTLTVAAAGRLRGALEDFAASRSVDGVLLREGDAEALPGVYAIVDGIADAHAAALRAALDAPHEAAL
jgi:hypothetical protein